MFISPPTTTFVTPRGDGSVSGHPHSAPRACCEGVGEAGFSADVPALDDWLIRRVLAQPVVRIEPYVGGDGRGRRAGRCLLRLVDRFDPAGRRAGERWAEPARRAPGDTSRTNGSGHPSPWQWTRCCTAQAPLVEGPRGRRVCRRPPSSGARKGMMRPVPSISTTASCNHPWTRTPSCSAFRGKAESARTSSPSWGIPCSCSSPSAHPGYALGQSPTPMRVTDVELSFVHT